MSKEVCVLAIDQGTTGATALVVARDGRILARAYAELPQYFPRPGWVEHDADEIWEVSRRVAFQATQESRGGGRIEAIGIANQRETVVVWDRQTLEPVCRAIVWQDRRTAGICKELRDGGWEESVRERTGLLLDPYFSGTKLTWLFRHRPDLRRRAETGDLAAGTVDSWLLARMTGGKVHRTDHTNASRTLLYDLARKDWEPNLLDLLEVPRGILPAVGGSSEVVGMVEGGVIGVEAPVAGMAGDQQAALFGQGCWSPGLVKNTYGTGAFLLLFTGNCRILSGAGLIATMACGERGDPAYALEGSIFVAGAALQWLRDSMGILERASDSEALARSLPSNEGVYFVPAFVGLGAPYWDPDARGVIVGLTRGSGRAHLARAALEAIAHSTVDVVEAMEAESGVPVRELRADGGASANDWLMRFQADLLGVPVRRPAMVETTALGAAGLAGLATGVWSSAEEFLGALGEAAVFEPAMEASARRREREGWKRAHRALRAWSTAGGGSV